MSYPPKCRHHPDKDATHACAVCQSPICDACVRQRADGAQVCADCLETEAPEPLELIETDAGPYDVKEAPAEAPPLALPRSGGFGQCEQHPDAQAVARCANCTKLVCATCDFAFPGGIHLCPACATNPKQGLTPKRKTMMAWSIGLGIMNVLIVVGIEIVVDTRIINPREALAALGCFGCLCLLSSPLGIGLGIASFSRRSHNPGILWLGPVLNGLAIAERVLVIIINQMR